MDENLVVGDIVISTFGHDQNNLFIVTSIDKNGFLYIIDGKYRLRGNPKKKNPKHWQKVAHDDFIMQKINSPLATDAEIYKLIKAYKNVKE